MEELIDKYLSSIIVKDTKEIPIHTVRGYIPAINLTVLVPTKFLVEYDFLSNSNYSSSNGEGFLRQTDFFHKIIDAPSKNLAIKLEDVLSIFEESGVLVNFKKISCDQVEINFTEKLSDTIYIK